MLWVPDGGQGEAEGLLPIPQCLLGAAPPLPTQLSETPQDGQHGIWCSSLSETPQDHPAWNMVLQVMPWLPSALSLGPLICISNKPPSMTSPHILIRHFAWKE